MSWFKPPTPATPYRQLRQQQWIWLEVHEIVGAQIVSVPHECAYRPGALGIYGFHERYHHCFFVISLLLNLLLHYIVVKPVRHFHQGR